jgi:hypothetical protein
MSLKDFRLTQRGFFNKQQNEYQSQWEQTRFIAFYGLQPYAKKGRLRTPKDLVEFEWEKIKAKEVELPTREEMEEYAIKNGRFMTEDGKFYN